MFSLSTNAVVYNTFLCFTCVVRFPWFLCNVMTLEGTDIRLYWFEGMYSLSLNNQGWQFVIEALKVTE